MSPKISQIYYFFVFWFIQYKISSCLSHRIIWILFSPPKYIVIRILSHFFYKIRNSSEEQLEVVIIMTGILADRLLFHVIISITYSELLQPMSQIGVTQIMSSTSDFIRIHVILIIILNFLLGDQKCPLKISLKLIFCIPNHLFRVVHSPA